MGISSLRKKPFACRPEWSKGSALRTDLDEQAIYFPQSPMQPM